jgi:hypothetical protein
LSTKSNYALNVKAEKKFHCGNISPLVLGISPAASACDMTCHPIILLARWRTLQKIVFHFT